MESGQEEGLPSQPSRPDQDTGGRCGPDLEGAGRASATPTTPGLSASCPPADPDDAEATRPPAALPEGLLLRGGKPSSHGAQPGPFFYIGGSNGASIVSSYCRSKGWKRTRDCGRGDYVLKWCEVKSRESYSSFREGEQLLYQLPNNNLLTTKIGLLSTLRGRAQAMSKASKAPGGPQARLGKDAAAATLEDLPWTSPGHLRPQRWTLKMPPFPGGHAWGRGRELRKWPGPGVEFEGTQARPSRGSAQQPRCGAPRYIQNPLLLDGRKFDVRSYLLIACAKPYVVFFGHGYARLTLSLYDPRSSDLSSHLTNQFMQKKNPLYALLKEDTVWSMERLNRHFNDTFRKARGLPRDWVFTTLTVRP
uniref:Tubulin tyrosine ligase like 10 n=1 Tax=Aotus nancymaae TaxID=37293 RepID=A0A2K5C568_AOTNA